MKISEIEKIELGVKRELVEKMLGNSVRVSWLENKIDELNDSHKEKADKLRKVLEKVVFEVALKVDKMTFLEVINHKEMN